ncbi:MAG: FMN-binding negative transcriptional regulator [Planctomycetota bacterium]
MLAIFRPHAYVSPSLQASSPDMVLTWNYLAVHVQAPHGKPSTSQANCSTF